MVPDKVWYWNVVAECVIVKFEKESSRAIREIIYIPVGIYFFAIIYTKNYVYVIAKFNYVMGNVVRAFGVQYASETLTASARSVKIRWNVNNVPSVGVFLLKRVTAVSTTPLTLTLTG